MTPIQFSALQNHSLWKAAQDTPKNCILLAIEKTLKEIVQHQKNLTALLKTPPQPLLEPKTPPSFSLPPPHSLNMARKRKCSLSSSDSERIVVKIPRIVAKPIQSQIDEISSAIDLTKKALEELGCLEKKNEKKLLRQAQSEWAYFQSLLPKEKEDLSPEFSIVKKEMEPDALLLCQFGVQCDRERNFIDAGIFYRMALQQEPTHPLVLHNLIEHCISQEKMDEGIEHATVLLERMFSEIQNRQTSEGKAFAIEPLVLYDIIRLLLGKEANEVAHFFFTLFRSHFPGNRFILSLEEKEKDVPFSLPDVSLQQEERFKEKTPSLLSGRLLPQPFFKALNQLYIHLIELKATVESPPQQIPEDLPSPMDSPLFPENSDLDFDDRPL
ncbi:MAG: hypothetical protein KGJ02_01815 [Verrucomicrobiota bacterium]|nr:hypothetical protein [Verrucomicrobiota bacterium]